MDERCPISRTLSDLTFSITCKSRRDEFYDVHYASFYGFDQSEKEFRGDGVFRGKASDYIKSKGEIIRKKPRNPLMNQNSGCFIGTVLRIYQFLKDSAIIIHGPTGCGSKMYVESGLFKPMNLFCTQTDENDAIMGGAKKLKATLKEVVERFKPGVIAVMETCTTSIIGDDTKGICETVEKEAGIPVIPIEGSGFRHRNWNLGTEAAFNILIDRMERAKEINKGSINILNFPVLTFHWADVFEFFPYLKRLRIKINTHTPAFMTFQEMLERFPKAQLNVVRCEGIGIVCAEYAEKRLGTPYLRIPRLISLKYTEEFIRGIGEFFNCQDKAENLIQEERERIKLRLDRVMSQLKGKRVAICAASGKNIGLAWAATELGMEVIYLAPYKIGPLYHERLKEWIEATGQDPILIAESSVYEDEAMLAHLQPDIYMGTLEMKTQIHRLGIPSIDVLTLSMPTHSGFEGVVNIGEILVSLLNNNLVRNYNRYLWGQFPPYVSEGYFEKALKLM